MKKVVGWILLGILIAICILNLAVAIGFLKSTGGIYNWPKLEITIVLDAITTAIAIGALLVIMVDLIVNNDDKQKKE